ncbi:GntR family transcriptional regulator [uncultured Enterococcus sp.]|uniref:GntR family transcriptional regulator n=1 Tax=uncultured Enterococcus sp. TaxID=167972 RepID=UPI002601B2DD|nr:GntR family transcriptional regulator [uncultured Enterococcus sp.]
MNNEALYVQVFSELKNQIEHGKLKKGQKLPTEAKLCKYFNVSRVTIRKSLQILENKGYISKVQGSGSVVIFSHAKSIINKSTKIRSFSNEMRAVGKKPSAKIIKFELLQANEILAAELQLTNNENIFYYERILYGDNDPYCFEYGYMPLRYFPEFSIAHLIESKMDYIENNKHIDIAYTHQVVHAILSDKKLHDYLQTEIGYPLLKITHIAYSINVIPINKTCVIFDSNKYEAHFVKYK